jgi:hypothetical protein
MDAQVGAAAGRRQGQQGAPARRVGCAAALTTTPAFDPPDVDSSPRPPSPPPPPPAGRGPAGGAARLLPGAWRAPGAGRPLAQARSPLGALGPARHHRRRLDLCAGAAAGLAAGAAASCASAVGSCWLRRHCPRLPDDLVPAALQVHDAVVHCRHQMDQARQVQDSDDMVSGVLLQGGFKVGARAGSPCSLGGGGGGGGIFRGDGCWPLASGCKGPRCRCRGATALPQPPQCPWRQMVQVSHCAALTKTGCYALPPRRSSRPTLLWSWWWTLPRQRWPSGAAAARPPSRPTTATSGRSSASRVSGRWPATRRLGPGGHQAANAGGAVAAVPLGDGPGAGGTPARHISRPKQGLLCKAA